MQTRWKFLSLALALGVLVVAGLAMLAPATRAQTAHIWTGEGPHVRALEVLTGRGSELGVTVRDIDDADVKREKLSPRGGAVVDEVRTDSPAEKAGLKAGDVVVAFDGERVRSARQFARLVDETPAGREIKATIVRDGKQLDVAVTPDRGSGPALSHPRMRGWFAEEGEPLVGDELRALRGVPGLRMDVPELAPFGMAGRPRLGVGVLDLSPELAAHLGAREGVLVNAVEPESPAAKAGIKVGDVITSVDGTSVDDGGELRRRLWQNEDATSVSIGIVRDRKAQMLTVPIEKKEKEAPGTGTSRQKV